MPPPQHCTTALYRSTAPQHCGQAEEEEEEEEEEDDDYCYSSAGEEDASYQRTLANHNGNGTQPTPTPISQWPKPANGRFV